MASLFSPLNVARTTEAHIAFTAPSVRFVVRMALRTVRLVSMTITAAHVFLLGHDFEVAGPHAGSRRTTLFANMIGHEPSRRGSYQEVMGLNRLASHHKLPISLSSAAYPQGAAVRTAGIDLSPEALLNGGSWDRANVSVPEPAHVVHLAPSATLASVEAIGNATLCLHRILQWFGVTRPDVSASRPLSILLDQAVY